MVDPAQIIQAKAECARFLEQLGEWLKPADKREAIMVLTRLRNHKPTAAKVTEALRDNFWEEYLYDLGDQPLWALGQACEWWRRLQDERFFPQSGQLRAKCINLTDDLRRDKRIAETVTGYELPKRDANHIQPEDWQALRDRFTEETQSMTEREKSKLFMSVQAQGCPKARAKVLKETQTKRLQDLTEGVPL